MVFQKILLVPIPFVQRKKPISKRANQTPNDSVEEEEILSQEEEDPQGVRGDEEIPPNEKG